MRRLRPLLALAAVVAVFAVPAISGAAPTCTTAGTEAACGGRVIPPALQTATFIRHDLEYSAILDALGRINPDVSEITPLGDLIGEPDLRSFDGHALPVIRLTDEKVEGPKRQVAISLSIHGNESAGREGGLRYVEDILRWSLTDPDHELYAGDTAVPLNEILAQTEIYVAILNPDGWADGDLGKGPTFNRGNGRGTDLNRQFPTIGWTKADQGVEPEAHGWIEFVGSLPRLTTATDIHGELTSANNAFSDIMYPAGEWSPREQAQELQFARNMNRTVERKFAEEGVVLQTLFDAAGDDRPMKPANFATAFDVVGYDDSGFMGDWFVREGAVEVDVENFLSHTVPNNVWIPALEQAHVAAVKGNMEATIVESMITHTVEPSLDLGRVAYVADPVLVSRSESEDEGAGYSVTRQRYFKDLAADAGVPVKAIPSAAVASIDLSAYDSIVLTDTTVPADTLGRPVDEAAYLAALDAFVKGGGQLVLTDSALQLLPALNLVDDNAIVRENLDGGSVDFGDLDHPWEADLEGSPNQSYYAVPLGYRSNGDAPNYGVTPDAFEALGGTAVGTIGGSDAISLGEIPHGDGSIAIFGAILPTQTQENRHDYGMANYAVTVNGGEVLNEILEYRR